MVTIDEIRSRLLERAKSQSSGYKGKKTVSKLAKPVVHESIFVYAADKVNGGMALAEKWNLTLEQPSIPQKEVTRGRRKSFMSGVNPTPNTEAGVTNDNEESKEVVATSQVFEIDESYFEPDSKQVLRNQMQDLTGRTVKLCHQLPMHALISSSNFHADIRWEKTKEWRN